MTVVGFVGLGLIGSRRLAIARDLGCEVAFAVDPDSAKRDTLRATIPSDCTYVSTIGDLAQTDLKATDAVFVAVPHDQALAACSWAFEHGAHVLCEKPMGVSLAQAVEIEKRAASANRIFCAGFNYRYLPAISGLSELLRGGQLGDIYRVRMMIGHGGRPGMEKEWKLVKARSGGGALIDPGIHLVDLARSLFGEPLVQAASLHRKFWDSDVEDNCRHCPHLPGHRGIHRCDAHQLEEHFCHRGVRRAGHRAAQWTWWQLWPTASRIREPLVLARGRPSHVPGLWGIRPFLRA